MLNNRKLIRFAEYVAVSASVVGAVATFSTQRPVYAIAPLTVSAALSLASREQQRQQTEAHIDRTVTQLNQQLDALVLQTQLLEQKLEQKLASALHNIQQQRTDATQQSAAITQTIQSVQQSLNQRHQTLTNEVAILQARIHNQVNPLDDFASVSSVSKLTHDFQQLQTSLDELSAACNQQIQQGLQSIQEQQQLSTQQLNEQQQLSTQRLNEQQQLSEQQQTDLTNKLSALESESSQAYTRVDRALEKIRTDLNSLHTQLSKLSIPTKTPPIPTKTSPIPTKTPPIPTKDNSTQPSNPFGHLIPQLPVEADYDLEINLGIDFGTGFTKVCFRELSQDTSEIVTFSEQAKPNEYLPLDEILMPTKLAILKDNTVLGGLTTAEWRANQKPVEKIIDFIKMRLVHLTVPEDEKWRLEKISELDDPETVESLCVYYLAQVIARSQQWILKHRPDMFENQTVRWSVNIGVPVEYCDSQALTRFKKVLDLAWLLTLIPKQPTRWTLITLNQLVQHLQQWKKTQAVALDCTTTPELSAAIWSFLSSRAAQDGFYTFFDIGDGTLDGTAFRFYREGAGDLHIDLYSGYVKPLGVTALTQQAATELSHSQETIRQSLTDTSDVALQGKIHHSDIRKDVQRLVASVVMEGHEKHHDSRAGFAKRDVGEHLKVFVGGGGGNTSFFPNTIKSTHSDFDQKSADIPAYQIKPIPAPNNLSINGLNPKDFNRFAVAYGLCIPSWEGPEVRLPSQVEAIDSSFDNPDDNVIPYEDTRDMM